MLLGDLGAEIICIEDVNYPFLNSLPHYKKGNYHESAFNSIIRRNKKSFTLDLESNEGRSIFYQLVETADIIIEGFRPGVTKKLKIDYDTIREKNKGIIYCSISGFGQTGPNRDIAGHNLNYLSLAGLSDLNRSDYLKKSSPVVNAGIQAADFAGSMYAAVAILAAVVEREKNDKKQGQFIDISLFDCAFCINPLIAAQTFSGDDITDNWLTGVFPFYSIYRTKDNKYLSLGAIEPKFWSNFCKILNLKEYIAVHKFSKSKLSEIKNKIESIFLTKTQSEWIRYFEKYPVCLTPILSFKEACTSDQIVKRNLIVDMAHPIFGSIKNVNSPIKMSRTPSKINSLAPIIGEHTMSILESLNYSKNQIKELEEKKVIDTKEMDKFQKYCEKYAEK